MSVHVCSHVLHYYIVVFEVITGMVTKNYICWNIALRGLVKVNWYFGGTCFFHLQAWTVSQEKETAWNKRKSWLCFQNNVLIMSWRASTRCKATHNLTISLSSSFSRFIRCTSLLSPLMQNMLGDSSCICFSLWTILCEMSWRSDP